MFTVSMRNLLDWSSIAQSLDGGRLKGSLLSPAAIFRSSAAHMQREPWDQDPHVNGFNHHDGVCEVLWIAGTGTVCHLYPRAFPRRNRPVEQALKSRSMFCGFTQAREHRSCRHEQSFEQSFALW